MSKLAARTLDIHGIMVCTVDVDVGEIFQEAPCGVLQST